MQFTGERFIPTVDGVMKYEHFHRYALCLPFVEGKTVLDIASGEGYGSAYLATRAKSVIGVDVDKVTVAHSRQKYDSVSNLRFSTGSADSMPIETSSIDVVTSFETIEHHDRHKEMFEEIKRVLRPDGLLIISSPNRVTYSEQRHYKNEFHVKELDCDEFVALISAHFKYQAVFGQRFVLGSFVLPLDGCGSSQLAGYALREDRVAGADNPLAAPYYFVAFCSDEKLDDRQSLIPSILFEGNDAVLDQLLEDRRLLCTSLETIRWMENSKVWKARVAWLKMWGRLFSDGHASSRRANS
jgi:SAM-dependent methyltransferase